MTTSEYLETQETVLPRELAFGVLHVAEAPTTFHQRAVRDLTIALTAFVDQGRLGEVLPAPVDVILDHDAALIVQPDVLFVSAERSHLVGDRIMGPPDLVVEVLSPKSRIGRLDERVGWFAQYGVRECWLVDLPRKEIAILAFAGGRIADRTLVSGRQTIASAVLPDLTLTPAGIFGWAWDR
jgi:Uma2 family endonuclease